MTAAVLSNRKKRIGRVSTQANWAELGVQSHMKENANTLKVLTRKKILLIFKAAAFKYHIK